MTRDFFLEDRRHYADGRDVKEGSLLFRIAAAGGGGDEVPFPRETRSRPRPVPIQTNLRPAQSSTSGAGEATVAAVLATLSATANYMLCVNEIWRER